uniref:SERPIN domain-containing protein n=1 Tax=Rhabditophanes sp. KR3021 TaxID=114890 RepID=A0AC35TVZ2_9BILA
MNFLCMFLFLFISSIYCDDFTDQSIQESRAAGGDREIEPFAIGVPITTNIAIVSDTDAEIFAFFISIVDGKVNPVLKDGGLNFVGAAEANTLMQTIVSTKDYSFPSVDLYTFQESFKIISPPAESINFSLAQQVIENNMQLVQQIISTHNANDLKNPNSNADDSFFDLMTNVSGALVFPSLS